jgi:transposase-like protein
MGTPPISDDVLEQSVAAYVLAGRNQTAAARELGVARETLQNRLKRAAERGLLGPKEALPGYAVKSVASKAPDGSWVKQVREAGPEFAVPDGHSVKGVSALVDAEGRVVNQWIKTREEPSALDTAEILKAAFQNFEPAAKPVRCPAVSDTDLLTLVPCNDWHVGMFAWNRETDANWDLKIAERVIGDGIEDAIARSPSSETAIVLGGGDLTHADNNKNQTSRSANQLDVDGRHQKIVEAAGNLMVRTVDAALRRNRRVIVRNLKGNHDEETAPAIAWFLRAWYRNEPRVEVDLDQSLFFYHRFGKVFLAATHGHEAKLKDMPQIMAHRRAEDWGATRFRYAHGFHIHHQSKFATEGGGVIMESHQAPIPQDAWHFGSGFLSGRSLQTITYHREYGEISRVRVAMLDAEDEVVA